MTERDMTERQKDFVSPRAVAKLLEQPQSYGNGYECCKQMIALARALRETREAYSSALTSLELAEKHSDEFAAEIEKLRDEIRGCSRHHAQSWQLPDWAKTRADIESATKEQLDDVMGVCHMEDGDPDDKCLACYAYEVICKREDEQGEKLGVKQRARGFSDGQANRSPFLLTGAYMKGYIEGRSERKPDDS